MERRVLGMPRGPSAGITTIRYTEPEVPRDISFVCEHGRKSLVLSARIGDPLIECEEKKNRWLQALAMEGQES